MEKNRANKIYQTTQEELIILNRQRRRVSTILLRNAKIFEKTSDHVLNKSTEGEQNHNKNEERDKGQNAS